MMTNDEIRESNFLVVDDDDFSREVIANALGFLGASKILLARDAQQASALARQHRPDFILLDIYMPEVDGWALLAQLREVVPRAAVIMVTGSNLPADFFKSMNQRVDGYCIKPVLPDIMQKALSDARRRRQLATP
jgi:DNA-binding NarL/FixJ family response regulator